MTEFKFLQVDSGAKTENETERWIEKDDLELSSSKIRLKNSRDTLGQLFSDSGNTSSSKRVRMR